MLNPNFALQQVYWGNQYADSEYDTVNTHAK